MEAFVLNQLEKSYDAFQLGPLSFSVPAGSIVGFIGENGAGKTTTIKTLLGMIHPNKGTVEILGKIPDAADGRWKEQVGIVLDTCRFPDNLTAKHIGAFMKRIYKTWEQDKYEAYLQRFSVPADKRVKELSRGMGMKLTLAVALSHDTRLLILDEATSGLDPVVRNEILDIFLDFVQSEDHTIFLSSHITADIEKIADYVLLLHQGKVLLYENKDTILYEYGILKCPKGREKEIDQSLVLGIRENAYGTEVLIKNREVRLPKGAAPATGSATDTVIDTVIDRVTLDDVLLFLTGKEEWKCADL